MAQEGFKIHPEAQEGEIFFFNVSANLPGMSGLDLDDTFQSMNWKTKRLGEVAYDISGNYLRHSRPVFVQRSEVIERGMNPDNLGWSHTDRESLM
jgi:hypothetical protein